MNDRIRFFLRRAAERLWIRPLAACLISLAGVFLARLADHTALPVVLDLNTESIETLLQTLAASMLVIATFAVGSMVTAYGTASQSASPRSFALVLADDVSQNALSTFIGAFIFSSVSLVAVKNGYYQEAGRLAIFSLTALVFALVILVFVRWVDTIARLGRLGTTMAKIEAVTATAFQRRRRSPRLGGRPPGEANERTQLVFSAAVGRVQRIDLPRLQEFAERWDLRICVRALPGSFVAPGRALASWTPQAAVLDPALDPAKIEEAFRVGDDRTFDEDPRFGIVTLGEIASRALSSAVNDPGTAIDVLGSVVRLIAEWRRPLSEDEREEDAADWSRVEVPELALDDVFDDAFRAIARDGAGVVEVGLRLQKSFAALAAMGDPALEEVATRHAREALARAERAIDPEDLADLRRAATLARATSA